MSFRIAPATLIGLEWPQVVERLLRHCRTPQARNRLCKTRADEQDIRLAESLRSGPPIPDLWPLFHSLDKIPLLAIRGARSDVLTAKTFEKMAAARPGLPQITVPESGHVPTLREAIVRDGIDAFLAGLPVR